ncbi:MAG: glycosyltransferase family 2 protein [Treponema sp.]|jgi:glycosyltransferase involved in cell wall biosynthesis|nr:glycosyltransferase family 2 protein [Treponema sp.]
MSGRVKQGIVIPVYNHGKTTGAVVEKLSSLGLPIIIVDDGSDSETKSCLEQIHRAFPLTVPVALEHNSGKGGAVLAGLKKAAELGFSHVLQIDADGQHDTGQAAFFLAESAAHPQAAICSYPIYDESVPASRKHGRKIGNTWAKIVTLSSCIVDSMVGFRVYPVTQVLGVCRHAHLDLRMGFDIEVLVRMVWKNIPLMYHPLRVYYPVDGISHFRPVRDNIGISLVYTKLCCGMLLRWPLLLWRKLKNR